MEIILYQDFAQVYILTIIDDNQIKDEGAKSIMDMLKINNTLNVLSLGRIHIIIEHNFITANGGGYFYEALSSNTSLTTLELKNNEIPDKVINDLKTLTYRNVKRKRKDNVEYLKTITTGPWTATVLLQNH